MRIDPSNKDHQYSDEQRAQNPVFVVTGANSGVGFGICHRLILQLSHPNGPPPDAQPQFPNLPTQDSPAPRLAPCYPVKSLTLVLACRSRARAEIARDKLLVIYRDVVRGILRDPPPDEDWLKIDIVLCDLAAAGPAFQFCEEMRNKYAYITHLILNAGAGPFTAIDWWIAAKQFVLHPMAFLTAPEFKVQTLGLTTDEGYGWTWHCNVFGHYILTRELAPLLQSGSPEFRSRILWMSSLEADPTFYDPDDWQLVLASHPYEASKYQMDLLVMAENAFGPPSESALLGPAEAWRTETSHGREEEDEEEHTGPRHVLVHPSITASDVFVARIFLGAQLAYIMLCAFYVARWVGSQFHSISPVKGAISATHASLAPLSALPGHSSPVKIGSRVTRMGREYVDLDPIKGWDDSGKERAKALLFKCERLYATLAKKWRGGELTHRTGENPSSDVQQTELKI